MQSDLSNNHITLRPSFWAWQQYLKTQGRPAIVSLLMATVVNSLAPYPPAHFVAIAVFALPFFVHAVLAWLKARVAYVQVQGDTMQWRTFIRRHEFRLADARRVQVRHFIVRPPAFGKLIVRDEHERALLRFDPVWWPVEATATVLELFGLTYPLLESAPVSVRSPFQGRDEPTTGPADGAVRDARQGRQRSRRLPSIIVTCTVLALLFAPHTVQPRLSVSVETAHAGDVFGTAVHPPAPLTGAQKRQVARILRGAVAHYAGLYQRGLQALDRAERNPRAWAWFQHSVNTRTDRTFITVEQRLVRYFPAGYGPITQELHWNDAISHLTTDIWIWEFQDALALSGNRRSRQEWNRTMQRDTQAAYAAIPPILAARTGRPPDVLIQVPRVFDQGLRRSELPSNFVKTWYEVERNDQVAQSNGLPVSIYQKLGRVTGVHEQYVRHASHGLVQIDSWFAQYATHRGAEAGYEIGEALNYFRYPDRLDYHRWDTPQRKLTADSLLCNCDGQREAVQRVNAVQGRFIVSIETHYVYGTVPLATMHTQTLQLLTFLMRHARRLPEA